MMMIRLYKFLIIFILFLSCEKSTDPIDSDIQFPPIQELYKFSIIQTNFDSLLVKSRNQIFLENKSITSLSIGYQFQNDLFFQDTIVPNYLKVDNGYFLDFQLSLEFPIEELYLDVIVHYTFVEGSSINIKSTIATNKYPYETTEVYRLWSEIIYPTTTSIQDFEFRNNYILFHPFGPEGLYEYDTLNGNIRELFIYPGGDYIAACSIYAFADVMHSWIYRYNFESDSVDIKMNVEEFLGFYSGICGIYADSNSVYLLTDLNTLIRFTNECEFNNIILKLPFSSFALTKHERHFFTVTGNFVIQFDENHLSYLKSPAQDLFSLHAHEGYMYFSDFDKQYIGKIKISELSSVDKKYTVPNTF